MKKMAAGVWRCRGVGIAEEISAARKWRKQAAHLASLRRNWRHSGGANSVEEYRREKYNVAGRKYVNK
jgi:hypothetical protein